MSTRLEELKYVYSLDLADHATAPLLKASREQERALDVQSKALRKLDDTTGKVTTAQKQAARETAAAAQLRAKAAGAAADREISSLKNTGKAYGQLEREQKQAARTAQDSSKHAGLLANSLKRAAGAALAAGAAYASIREAKDAVNTTVELGHATLKLHNNFGLSIKTASEFAAVMHARGIDAKQGAQAFATLSKQVTASADGSKSAAKNFALLGISQKDLKGKDFAQQLGLVADGLRRAGPGTDKVTAATKLLGRGWQTLTPLLAGGSAKMQEQLALADKYGATLGGKTVKDVEKMIEVSREQKLAMLGIQVTLGSALLPLFTKASRVFATFVGQVRTGTGAGGQFRDAVVKIYNDAQPTIKTMLSLGRSILTFSGTVSDAFHAVAPAIKYVLGIFVAFEKGVGRTIRGVAHTISSVVHGNFRGALHGMGDIAGGAIDSLVGVLKNATAPVRKAGASIARAIFSGIKSGIAGAAGFVKNIGRSIADWLNAHTPFGDKVSVGPLHFRIPSLARGGIVGRYAGGGLVPALVSPGEEVHHGGGVWTVPGPRVTADNVFTMLPVGAAVVTGSGQQMMAGGASLTDALSHQAPHFQAGGVVRGKVSTFGPPGDKDGPTAYGHRSSEAGIAVNPDATASSWNNARALSFARKIMHVVIGSKSADLRVIDKGPSIPGRAIDVSGAGAREMGIDPEKFPTGQTGTATLAGAATTGGYRTLAASQGRQGILADAFQQGITAGQAGLRTPGILNAVQQAGKATKVPARTTTPSSSSSPSTTTTTDGAVNYAGVQIAGWIKPVLSWAAAHGWTGSVSDGVRTRAQQRTAAAGYSRRAGKPISELYAGGNIYASHHLTTKYPGGAVDVDGGHTDQLQQVLRAYRGARKLIRGHLVADPYHFSADGHRRGGLIGRVARFQAGGQALKGAVTAATSFKKGALTNLDQVIGDAAESRLLVLKARMLREARKGGDERIVKRYQQVVSLIDGQLGLRIGKLQAGIEARTARTTFATDLVSRRLRGAGIDAASTQGLQITAKAADKFEIPDAKANLRDAQAAFRKAQRAHASPATLKGLQDGITAAIGALDEALTSQVERRRQIIQKAAQDKVDDAQFRVDWNNAGLAFLDASQRVQGTADTSGGMLAKAAAIRDSLPGLEAARAAQQDAAQAALQANPNDLEGFHRALLAATGAATDLANAQADAAELVKAAAETQANGLATAAEFHQSVAQAGLESLKLDQQLAGTDKTAAGGQARASYIRDTVIPAIQADITAQKTVVQTELEQRGADSAQYQAAVLKLLGLGNDLKQDTLDATNEVAANTEPLKDFTGSSAFELHGQQFLAGLLGAGTGA